MSKKKCLQMMFATMLALMTFCFFSCSNDDEDEQSNGSHNTTDVAVTGNVTNLGVSYAYICGYVNLHLITTSYSSQQIGIELSESEDFYYSQETRTRELEGNKLTVMVENLNAHTKYYYRTFVKVNDLKYYGEKRSFKTKDFTNVTSTGNVEYLTLSSATIKCKVDTSSIDHNNKYVIGVAYSDTKSKLQTDSVYVGGWTGFYTQSIRLNDIEKDTYFITISKLQANTTYYYCSYTYAGGKYKLGEIKSFTTTVKDNSYWDWDEETYDEMKKQENNYISKFVRDSAINVISETIFNAQGKTTDLIRNEFVYLSKSGVYMQIINKGDGSPLEDGKSTNLLCRFFELNIKNQTVLSNSNSYIYQNEKLNVQRTGSTYTASFVTGRMYETYGAIVPAGWLVTFNYLNIGRTTTNMAKVRLIVPHSQGHDVSSRNVCPYYYELAFQRER